MTHHLKQTNTTIYIFIASLWLIFSSIYIIQAAHEEKWLIHNTWELEHIFWQQDYHKALQSITGDQGIDFYNRATIETIIAYQQAYQNTISWRETAQTIAQQAQKNFDIAKTLGVPKTIEQAIQTNTQTLETLVPIIDIKTCYGIGQAINDKLDDFYIHINNTKDIISNTNQQLEKNANTLPTNCYQKIKDTLAYSTKEIDILQKEIQKQQTNYAQDIQKKLQDPKLCLNYPYKNIIPTIEKGKKWLETYEWIYKNIQETLKKNNTIDTKKLCEQTKNDAQIHQKIQYPLQDMFDQLQKNTSSSLQKHNPNSDHQDISNQEKQELFKLIQETNSNRIQKTLQTKGKVNYDPQKYIEELFNQFYGNSGDFINLHK